ncbi:MAG TPA: helix-turn-helix domain-containing protein [bacterium]
MVLIDIGKLEAILQVKRKTIYDWVHKGQIPYIKLGHLLRFDLNQIEQWVKSRQCGKRIAS